MAQTATQAAARTAAELAALAGPFPPGIHVLLEELDVEYRALAGLEHQLADFIGRELERA